MLLALWTTWVGQSVAMGLSGNHRRGCRAASMEGVCHGEACHRVEVLLRVRDGRAREDDHGQGSDGSAATTSCSGRGLYPRGHELTELSLESGDSCFLAAFNFNQFIQLQLYSAIR